MLTIEYIKHTEVYYQPSVYTSLYQRFISNMTADTNKDPDVIKNNNKKSQQTPQPP